MLSVSTALLNAICVCLMVLWNYRAKQIRLAKIAGLHAHLYLQMHEEKCMDLVPMWVFSCHLGCPHLKCGLFFMM